MNCKILPFQPRDRKAQTKMFLFQNPNLVHSELGSINIKQETYMNWSCFIDYCFLVAMTIHEELLQRKDLTHTEMQESYSFDLATKVFNSISLKLNHNHDSTESQQIKLTHLEAFYLSIYLDNIGRKVDHFNDLAAAYIPALHNMTQSTYQEYDWFHTLVQTYVEDSYQHSVAKVVEG